ncbi:hypothetical protein HK105_200779 [Polyrhizophydium stewartii]|uniref:Uncharacterized protein n=1 Tax=Polyrhizophydium stewartii TaxID=2732419 RepID=A0ABR4NK02_9FUNG
MSYGVAKCGVMCIRAKAGPPPALDPPVLLHEQAVPFVSEYRCLGAIIDDKLSFKPWLEHKRAAVFNAVHALAPVLANRRFSVRMRHRVFVAVVLGIARYGIEVFAGMKTGLSRVQPAINKGVRMIFGVRPSTAVGPLLVESGVPLLSVLSHVATVRLLDRAVHKRTFVRLICSGDVNPVRRIVNGVPRVAGKMYWSRRAKKLHNDLRQAGVTLNDADTRSGFARVRTLAALTTNRASQRYQAAGFSLTSGSFTQPLFDQPRSRGTRLLAALRMDGLWTARTALRVQGLLVHHPFNLRDCILCNENIADLATPRALNALTTRRLVWSRGSVRLHHRFMGRTWLPDAWATRELRSRMHERRMLVSPAHATASYRDHQFAATTGFFRSPMLDASLSNGVRYLIAARCNAIWTTSRAVAARLLRNGHPFVGRQ